MSNFYQEWKAERKAVIEEIKKMIKEDGKFICGNCRKKLKLNEMYLPSTNDIILCKKCYDIRDKIELDVYL